MAVSEFQKGVYTDLKKGETWDRFNKELAIDFLDKASQRRYIAYAASMIQLAIGSRAKGVYGVNKIHPVFIGSTPEAHQNITAIDDDEVTAEEQETGISGPADKRDFDCASTQLITITRLSKEKDTNLKEAIQMHILRKEKLGDLEGDAGKVDLDADEEKVLEEKATEQVKQDNMARQITKPFQYYLFDPLSDSTKFFDGDKPITREERADRLSSDAKRDYDESNRLCFFCLLRVLRKLVMQYSKAYGTPTNKWKEIKWETVHGGTPYEHLAVSEKDVLGKEFDQLKNDLRADQGVVVSTAFEHLGPDIPRKTHELRRLYACYSYQFFGVRTMKEMAYAQRVLGHRNLETSAFYTSLQIQLIPGTGMAGKKLDSGKLAIDFVDVMKTQVTEYLKSIGYASSGPSGLPQPPIEIIEEKKDGDGEEKIINGVPKFKSAKGPEWHKMPKDVMRERRVKRSLDAIKMMREEGFEPSKRALKRLGETDASILNDEAVEAELPQRPTKKRRKA